MRAAIIYDHPWEGSYVHAMSEAVQKGLQSAGHEIDLIDLHADGFDPVMGRADLAEYANGVSADPKVADYQQRMAAAQHLFFIFPVWWDLMPAMTKGFLDKVFLKHFAFEKLPEGGVKGLLSHCSATLFTSMASPSFWFKASPTNPVRRALIKGTLKTCGVPRVKWYCYGRITQVSPEQRQKWLREIEDYARGV